MLIKSFGEACMEFLKFIQRKNGKILSVFANKFFANVLCEIAYLQRFLEWVGTVCTYVRCKIYVPVPLHLQ
jgi:hypothetical protein